jgi:outer membrane protein assembly factor BamA
MLAIVFYFYSALTSIHPHQQPFTDADEFYTASILSGDTTHIDTVGHFLEINRIFIIGNRITKDDIIFRELTLKSGDIIYSTDLKKILERDKKKLFNTKLFNTVDIRILELSYGKADLLVDVNERWYTFPSPIFELHDRNFNEWWQNYRHDFRRFNYGLRLYQFNMRGRNETLRFQAQFGYTRKFNINYRIPYIDKKKRHGITLDIRYEEAKNLAYQTIDHKLEYVESDDLLSTNTTYGIAYNFRPSFYQTHSLRVSHTKNNISNTIIELKPTYFKEGQRSQEYTSIAYQFTTDLRDYMAYPLKGHYLTAFATQHGLSANADLNKFEINLIQATYVDLGKHYNFSNNILGYWSNRNTLPYANYSALGYQKQFVRGYEVYIIEGPRYLLNKTTFKKRIFSRNYVWERMPINQFKHFPLDIYWKTYGDLGYVHNYDAYPEGSKFTNKLLVGYGTGIDIVGFYDVVMRIEYSINSNGGSGFFVHLKKEF